MTTFISRSRALAALALTTAILAPAAGFAYTIVRDKGFDVYKCKDGTLITCIDFDDSGNSYQVDCVSGTGGERACEGHGGFVGITPDPIKGTLVANYTGHLPLAGLAGLAGDGDINSTCSATLVVVCKSGETFQCDDAEVSCPKSYDEANALCARRGGVESIDVYAAFQPRR
ncbi:Hypothetical protein A7982_07533 [Minicystis rosea]|nr:Hypothetical protein A7982_07533 [Minicystis rosea]